MRFLILSILIGITSLTNLRAQKYRQHQLPHSIAVGLSHTHIFDGVKNGQRTWIVLPSFLVDYDYHFNEDWSAGLHFDMVVENFEFEPEGEISKIKRTFPLSIVAVGSYKIFKYASVQIGTGIESSKEETFSLVRTGISADYEIGEKFEILLDLSYDYRFDAYSSITLGLGIKRFF